MTRQQQHCKQLVNIYRDFAKAKTFSFKQDRAEQNSVSLVWRHVGEENNCGLKISVIKIYCYCVRRRSVKNNNN